MDSSKTISFSVLIMRFNLSTGISDSIDVSQQIPIKFLLPKGTFTYWPILILASSEI